MNIKRVSLIIWYALLVFLFFLLDFLEIGSLIYYDLKFLILFSLIVTYFLYKNRKNLGKEKMLGLPVYLYRTKWGMKKIDEVGKKYSGFLHFIKYISIAVGFVLMAGIIYIILKSVYIYAVFPQITQVIKAPPITPLIPYFPQLFGVESFFPPFYFTYFLVALAIVAIVHEFAHGIFMRLYNIKIKSTGFAFFGPFLGAFVEQDEKSFSKSKKIAQMSVLSAGVFANIIFALIFFLLLVGFFFAAFQPAGYQFNTYAYSFIPASAISIIDNSSSNFTKISAFNQTFLLDEIFKEQLNQSRQVITAYDDAPAINSNLKGAIKKINEENIRGPEDFREKLMKHSPGESVNITTIFEGKETIYQVTLGKNPQNESAPFLGVGSVQQNTKGVVSKFIKTFTGFKDANTYYEPKFDGDAVVFIYDLLWWIMIINFLVGLFNMLPAGPFDGGRFFYLGVLSLTKSEKVASRSFKVASWIIGLLFALLVALWFFAFI